MGVLKIKINNFAERGNFHYIINFTVDNTYILETGMLNRSDSLVIAKDAIRDTIADWVAKRADDNFAFVRDRLEGKEIEIP